MPNVDGGLQAAVDGDGRLINVRGGPLPDPQGPAPVARITAAAAYEAAVPGAVPAPPTGTARGADQRTPFLGGGEASLVLYRDGGVDRLGWRVLVSRGSTAFYDAIVDARTGRLVRRVNRTHAATQIRHFSVNPRASGDTTAQLSPAPAGWLDGERRLKGPYVHAVADLDDTIWLVRDAGGYHLNQAPDATDEVEPSTLPADPDQDWDYLPQIGSTAGFCSQCSWSEANTAANREFSTAQLFWYVNTFRDHLAAAPIGFTGLGAFEGDDAVIAQTLDGADTGPDAAARLQREHDRPAGRVPRPDADVPLLERNRPVRRRDGRGRRVPRVHARAERAARHRRAGLRRARGSAAGSDRRGHQRLLRVRLPRREGAGGGR